MIVADKVRAEEALGRELAQYAGQWVAIIDYTVVETGATLSDLLERIDDRQRRGAEIVQVPENPEAVHFY